MVRTDRNMSKKNAWIVAGALAALCALLFIFAPSPQVSYPLESLKLEEISDLTLHMEPPDITFTPEKQDTEKLVQLLNKVIVLEEDSTQYMGQAVTCTITKTDGSTLTVLLTSPSVTVNGTQFKGDYESCEAVIRYTEMLRTVWEDTNR